MIGLGRENLVKVSTKQNGEMDVEQLDLLMTQMENENQNGPGNKKRIPYFVGITSGSTVRGSFDDIEAVTRVCKKHEDRMNHIQQGDHDQGAPMDQIRQNSNKIWIHVDGAWGGPAVFSQREDIKGLVKGLSAVDSFTFNPHKMLGAPQQTTAFVTRHEASLSFFILYS